MNLTKIVRKAILTATFVGGLLLPTNAFAVKYAKSGTANVDYVSVTMNLTEDFADEVNCEFKESGVPVTSVTVPTSSSGILTATTSSLPDGVYDYSCVAKDTSLNLSTPPVTGTVGVDMNAPVLTQFEFVGDGSNGLPAQYSNHVLKHPAVATITDWNTGVSEVTEFLDKVVASEYEDLPFAINVSANDSGSGLKSIEIDWG